MRGSEGTCTKCGYVGIIYYMKPHFSWCAGCMKKVIVNTPAMLKIRPTWKKTLRPRLRKMNERITDLETHVRLLNDKVAFLQAKLGRQPGQSVAQQVRELLDLTPESVATVVGGQEAIRSAVRRERQRRQKGHDRL